MDDARRKTIVKNMKQLVLHGSFNGNPDYKRFAKDIIANPKGLLDENDSFNFDNSCCTTKCDGHCCNVVDIVRISPVDVDNIMKSGCFKMQTRESVVKKTLDVFLGYTSKIPMATIRFLTLPGTSIKLCPFSIIIAHQDPRQSETNFNGICMLGQANKPTICMLYPLGRMKEDNTASMNSALDSEWIYFSMQCEGTKTSKQVKIKDFIGNINEKNAINDDYIKTMDVFIEKLKENGSDDKGINDMMLRMASIFYYVDESTQSKLEKTKIAIDTAVEAMKNVK